MSVDPHYQEVLDESEELDSDGHVVRRGFPFNFMKDYSDDKAEYHPNRFFSLYKLLLEGSTVDTPDALEKSENVEELAEAQEELDINHPAIIYRDGTYSEYEFIPGDTLEEELEEFPSDIRDISCEIGAMTSRMHRGGFARYDNRAVNIIIDRSGLENSEASPYFIDSEYVETDAEKADKNLDLVSFLDSVNHRDPRQFKEVFEGFREGYGKLPVSAIALAGLRTVAEKTLEQEFEESSNALGNTLRAFYFNRRNNSYGKASSENTSYGMGIPSED